jgi:Ca2+-binding RTX toxin-like protein
MATYRGTANSDYFFEGTTGDDTYYGYGGHDTFRYSTGHDTYYGGERVDRVSYINSPVAVVADLLAGYSSHPGQAGKADYFFDIENIDGSYFNDRLYGDNDINELRGSLGQDRLYGRGGPDTLYADPTDLMVDGGAGSDTLVMVLNDAGHAQRRRHREFHQQFSPGAVGEHRERPGRFRVRCGLPGQRR